MRTFLFQSRRLTFGALSLFLAACTPQSNSKSVANHDLQSRLMPPPVSKAAGEPLSLHDQLKRFRGQTEFASAFEDVGRLESGRAAMASASGARSQQESDIFKVGKPGSKLLFLLNNARGLQVVSFAKGADQPELIGHVKATGNYPDNMYYDAARDRLIVLENLWWNTSGNYEENQSRLLVYDVANPNAPSITAEIPVKGEIADSRIVGDVLYVASSVRPSTQYNANAPYKGVITSYDLRGKKLAQVQSYDLSLPAVYGDNMNIQTVENADGSLSYYLVAVLSETGWGWWDRESLVEVIDISDERGQISPVMTVSAKGAVRERSQTHIKDGTLIVTSNYFTASNNPADVNERSIARIAVETFSLPKANAEIISEREAKYRQLHIERALDGQSGETLDTNRANLLKDAKLGLTGRFVRVDSKLRKVVPDSVVTVGDTTGLSTSLQDVRYQDGLLYAFWVPTNMVDPLDIFDIRNPEKGATHLSRLQFDGWISKAVPLSLNGRQFILGLGWIVPAVDNENSRRQPQAMLFEIKKSGAKYKAEEVAQLTFASRDIWTDFNASDKFIEVRENGDGTGQVLFSASQWDTNSYLNGGKVLNFDLNVILKGEDEKSLNEGVFLVGSSGWIRRVFTNNEIDRINTFSDKALGVFDAKAAGEAKLAKASAILELARHIRGYQTLAHGSQNRGVQIISEPTYYYRDEAETATTILRLVDATKADTEKRGVQSEVVLPGSYNDSFVEGNRLYILSSNHTNYRNDTGEWIWRSTAYISAVQLDANGKTLVVDHTQVTEYNSNSSLQLQSLEIDGDSLYGPRFVRLQDGTPLVQLGDSLFRFTLDDIRLTKLEMKNCTVRAEDNFGLKSIGGLLFFSSQETLDSEDFPSARIRKSYIAPAQISGSTLTCGQRVNIPGELVAVSPGGALLTKDTWALDVAIKTFETNGQEYTSLKQTQSLLGLVSKDGKAVLVDELPNSNEKYGNPVFPTQAGQVVRIGDYRSGSVSRGFGSGWGSSSYADPNLEFISIGDQGLLTQESIQLDLGSDNQTSVSTTLLGLFPHPKAADTILAVLQTNRQIQVLKWTSNDRRPVVQSVIPLSEQLDRLPSATAVFAPSYGLSRQSVHFTPQQLSFEIAEGSSGLTQFFLTE